MLGVPGSGSRELYASLTFEGAKIAAEKALSDSGLTLAYSKLLSFIPRRSATIRASLIQNIQEQSFSLGKEIGLVRCPPTLGVSHASYQVVLWRKPH